MDQEEFDHYAELVALSLRTGCEIVVTTRTYDPQYAQQGGRIESTGVVTRDTDDHFYLDGRQIAAVSVLHVRLLHTPCECGGNTKGSVIEGICDKCARDKGWLV